MSGDPAQFPTELGAAFLEKLRAEVAAAVARAAELTAVLEAAERIVPSLAGDSEIAPDESSRELSPSANRNVQGSQEPSGVVPARASTFVERTVNWARLLHGLTQEEALIVIAKRNDGRLNVTEARDILKEAGLTRSDSSNAYRAVHGLLRKSDRFAYAGTGEFRLMPTSEPRGEPPAEPPTEQPVIAHAWRKILPDSQ